jgi:hypothetical protein
MSWKTDLQIMDLEPNAKLEVTCKKCSASRYEYPAMLISKMGLDFQYLDEVERLLYCNACRGDVRIALSAKGETEGFVGGLA